MFDLSTITTEQRNQWRTLVANYTGPKTRGYAPCASPIAALNALATHIDPVPVVLQDFVAQQGRAPLWAARTAASHLLLHARFVSPVVERSSVNFYARMYATIQQCGVDCLLGLFALFRAAALAASGRVEEAREMVVVHAIHIACLITVGVTLGLTTGMIVVFGV